MAHSNKKKQRNKKDFTSSELVLNLNQKSQKTDSTRKFNYSRWIKAKTGDNTSLSQTTQVDRSRLVRI